MKRNWTVTAAVVLTTLIGLLGYGVTPASAHQAAARAAAPMSTTPTVPILKPGDSGPRVRVLQARLRQLGWFTGNVIDTYGARTTNAVKAFETRHKLPRHTYVDWRTMKRLNTLTHAPSKGELANQYTDGSWTGARLDKRCRTNGHVLCVDKSSRTLRWVIDGEVRKTLAVRFGSQFTPTREGLFHVGRKSRDHVSSLYHTSMPFAMFFSGGQAVHYSPDFAARGYAGASHGCVNVRDRDGIAWLFDQVRIGDAVVVYWS